MKNPMNDSMRTRGATVLVAWAVFALLAGPVWAGGDGGGVPVIPGSASADSNGGDNTGGGGGSDSGGGNASSTVSSSVTHWMELVPGVLDSGVGTIEITTVDDPTLEPVADPGQAMLVAGLETPASFFEVQEQTVRVQGAFTLAAYDTVDARLVVPSAKAHVALLVLDDGTGTLGTLLSGETKPDIVVLAQMQPEIDLRVLAKKVANTPWVATLGVKLSIVTLSVGAQGGLHVTAARVGADGSIEVVAN